MLRVSIMGCGWYGFPLAEHLLRAGFEVNGSTTTADKSARLHDAGIYPFLLYFDPGVKGKNANQFFDADVLVLNIPPGRKKPNVKSWYALLTDNVIRHIAASRIRHVIFISSTSVYPDLNRIVTEQDAGPDAGEISASGSALFSAENEFLKRTEFETTVLRFGGLYGPERHPTRFLAGRKNISNPDTPVNLIHQTDCIRITERVIVKKPGNVVFSAVSDEHPTKSEYYSKTARMLGLTPPQFEKAEHQSWKTVSNELLKTKLGYSFKYPSPFDGLEL